MQTEGQKSEAVEKLRESRSRQSKNLRNRLATNWTVISDWLGKHRPLDLILGSCAIITLVSAIAEAISSWRGS